MMNLLLTLLSLISLKSATAFIPSSSASYYSTKIILSSTTTTTVDAENPQDNEAPFYLDEISALVEDESSSNILSSETIIGQERSESMPFLPRPMNLEGWVGDVGFDPWGFSNRYPVEYLREAELKHGRVASLAWLGWVAVDLGLRIYPAPLEEWQASSSAEAFRNLFPSNAVVNHPDGYWTSPFLQALVIIGCIEGASTESVNKMFYGEESDRDAGDVGFDVLNILKGKSDAEIERMKLRELKNVRLGMFAFFGVLVQSVVLGYEKFPYVGP